MKHLLRFASLAALALILVQPLSAAKAKEVSAADSSDGQLAGTVVVPDGLKASEVQRSILEAATGRGWTIKSKGDDGKVALFLENGRWVALLHLVYDTKEIQIYSKSTRNGKPGLPEDWIKYIKQDVTKSMNAKAFLK